MATEKKTTTLTAEERQAAWIAEQQKMHDYLKRATASDVQAAGIRNGMTVEQQYTALRIHLGDA